MYCLQLGTASSSMLAGCIRLGITTPASVPGPVPVPAWHESSGPQQAKHSHGSAQCRIHLGFKYAGYSQSAKG